MIDTEALRKKVIDLAVQGKLTQQLPEDGNAEDLYAQIQKEKAQLIKEGKIKKEKPLPEISDDEILFEIPSNWKWVQLNDIGSWSAGATPSRKNKEYYRNGTIPWIKTGELNDGYIYDVEECITDKAFEESSVRLNPIGSVLIAMYGATIGKVGILGINATTNQACCACIPILIDNRFLFYFLKGNKDQFINSSHGGAQPNISKEIIVQSRFPLPPLAEQKRIVEILNDVLAQIDIIDALQQQYESDREILKGKIIDAGIRGKLTEQLDDDGSSQELYAQILKKKEELQSKGVIRKSKVLPSVTEKEIPFEVSENWTWVRFGNVISLQSGQDLKPEEYNSEQKGIPYMTGASNYNEDGTMIINRWTLNPKSLARQGDILLSCKGTVGKLAILGIDEVHIARQIMGIRTFEIDTQFCLYFLQSVVDRIKSAQKGLIPGIERNDILNLAFPLPPLAEQRRIAAIIEELLDKEKRIEKINRCR